MDKITRDTTKDLFLATLALAKENGHYDKAAAIMDYVLPNDHENNVNEDIELSDYQFDFEATAQFGGSEGIYIDCYLSGKYTEDERKRYNHSTGQVEPERRRHIGTFKTLKEDVDSFKIMGELCGALTFYAHQYVNRNIDRYTPAAEAERHRQHVLEREAAKRQAIAEAVRNAPAGTFEYGGFHFTPCRPFYKGETDKRLEGDSRPWKTDMQYAMRNMKSDPDMGLLKAKAGFTHEAFYAASGGSKCDIFRCVENGKLYVPGNAELFQYTEPPHEERIAQAVKNGKASYTAPNEDAPISVFLLGGAAFDGKNHGAWLKLPADADALRNTLDRIGAKDGKFSIVAAQSLNGQIDALLPTASGLDELNMLAGFLKASML